MSVTFTQVKQTIDLFEKVKVDSGEKIVKNEKIGRRKNRIYYYEKKGVSSLLTLMVKNMQHL